jgi:MFS transporter, DHA1 family, 2-module integral membrane pump EmrD
MKKSNNTSYSLILLLAIGLMTVGQVPAGIYLPSMISMRHFFHVSHGHIQYVLGIYLFMYGVSQLIYGPLSDYYGRKSTVIIGLVICIFGSLCSIFSKDILEMYLGSALQGIGLGSVAVVSTAILRDLYDDNKRLLAASSYRAAAVIVTPLAAPILGGYLQTHLGWQATFGFSMFYALLILVLIMMLFTETNTRKKIRTFSFAHIIKNYTIVIKSPNFITFGGCRILALSGGTAYAATAPFLFQTLLHFSPITYAWTAAIPASGFFIGALSVKKLGKQLAPKKIVNIGALFLLVGGVSLLVLNTVFSLSVLTIVVPMLIYMCGSGIIFPSAMTGAILPLGMVAGTAAAFIGSLQNLGRGFFSSFVGYFHNNSIMPLALTVVVLSLLCFFVSLKLKD